MYEITDHLALLSVPLFIAVFHGIGFVMLKDLWNMNPYAHFNFDEIFQGSLRGEQISFTLAGFSVLSIIFIISVFKENVNDAELVLVYFSMGFIFEIFSAFLFHILKKYAYQYSAIVFQYAGLFSILIGFLSYFTSALEWSLYLYVVYIIGVIGFIILTIKELQVFIEYRNSL